MKASFGGRVEHIKTGGALSSEDIDEAICSYTTSAYHKKAGVLLFERNRSFVSHRNHPHWNIGLKNDLSELVS
jgi:hypothetical protein